MRAENTLSHGTGRLLEPGIDKKPDRDSRLDFGSFTETAGLPAE